MLFVRNLAKSFGSSTDAARVVFSAASLDVHAGELVAIMGESGVGKSTFLNIIAGLETADTGSIELAGVTFDALDDEARTLLRRRAIGFVFQAFHVLPYLSVADNIALPLALNDWLAADREARVGEMLAAVGLAARAKAAPRELSGGELQRVAIARALAHRPSLVLADEPTGNLDPETADQVLRLLATEIRRNRAAAILVTHSHKAASVADRVLVLRRNGLVELPRSDVIASAGVLAQ